jgi:hypothetical protein
MNIIHLSSEKDYISRFHNLIDPNDPETFLMSNHSINFYRSFYKFEEKPVKVIELDGDIVSALFYSIPKRENYVTILNILTPVKYRQKGYAKILMENAVAEAYAKGKRRIRMNCDNISGTIKFYNKLGCKYLGVTNQNALYCNMPLVSNNIADFHLLNNHDILLMEDTVVRLAKRRMSQKLSKQLYIDTPEYVDLTKYKYNEFVLKHGDF